MKAKKCLLAVAAAATVISGLPLPVLADTPEVMTSNNAVQEEENKKEEAKKIQLLFVDENGKTIGISNDEEESKKFEKTIDDFTDLDEDEEEKKSEKPYRVEFDLSDVDGSVSIDGSLYPDYEIEYDEEEKKLTVYLDELTENEILKVKVVNPAETGASDMTADEDGEPENLDQLQPPTSNDDSEPENPDQPKFPTADNAVGSSDTNQLETPASDNAVNPGELEAIDSPQKTDANPTAQAAEDSAPSAEQNEKATVTINFVYSDSNKPVANPCVIQVQKNSSAEIAGSWPLAAPLGYELDEDSLANANIFGKIELSAADGKLSYKVKEVDGDYNLTVKYKPSVVNYTVVYYQQNVDSDEYTKVGTETRSGKTGTTVASGLNSKDKYPGFYGLNYDTTETIAADGTTEVSIYYDRDYYLMRFDLDGGYGTEPVYGRYGSPVSVTEPKKAGYDFAGWTDNKGQTVTTLPATLPAEDTVYTANWMAAQVNYTVVYWTENANDTNYSLATTATKTAQAGTIVNGNDIKTAPSEIDKKHFTFKEATGDTEVAGDGSTVINVYYSRNVYTYTFKNGKKEVHTFKAKYDSDISDKWAFKGTDGTDYPNYATGKVASWEPSKKTPNGVSNRICRQSKMEGANITWRLSKDTGKNNTYIYYVEALDGQKADVTFNGVNYIKKYEFEQDFNLVYPKEEFFNIDGFDKFEGYQSTKNGDKKMFLANSTEEKSAGLNTKWKFYYKRKKYNLTFSNYDETTTKPNVPFEAPLNSYNWTPTFPEGAGDASAMKFEGWYTSPYFNEGTKIDFSSAKMPADNVILFAHWVPITHTVTFYKDSTKTDQHDQVTEVNHGSVIDREIRVPVHVSGPFIGWFYTNENGEEKAFDHKNTPVVQDLELYAKHRNDTVVNYTVSYVYVDESGNKIDIAPSKTGSGLVGRNKTENALTGDSLNAGYQDGYFPRTRSTSIVLDAQGENSIVFEYVKAASVPYTVKYLDANTGENVFNPKNLETSKAVVTETAPVKPGYVVDSMSKTLIVEYSEDGTAKNEIIFRYTQDAENANVGERYFKDDEADPFLTKPDVLEKKGTVVKLTPSVSLPSYKLDKVVITDAAGKVLDTVNANAWESYNGYHLDENGLVFNFYYAGYFNVYLQSNNGTAIELKYLDYKDNLDVTDLVPITHLYGGLYTNISFSTPKTDIGNGKQLKPVVGGNYYVKTVDRNYLVPTVYAIYNLNSNVIDRIDVLTAVDDTNYQHVSTGHPYHLDTATDLFQTLQINRKDENGVLRPYDTQTASSLFYGVNSGFLSAYKVANGKQMESSQNENGVATYTYYPHYLTPDGVLVRTQLGRTYTFKNRDFVSAKFENHFNLQDGKAKTEVYSAPQTSSQMRVRAAYVISDQPEVPEAPEAPETPIVPEETNTVNVTTVVDGSEKTITADKGVLTNKLPVENLKGKVFAGWYRDSAYSVPADLTDIQEDTIVYGRYIPLSDLKINASKVSGNSKSMKCSVSVQSDSDIYQNMNAMVEYNGKSETVTLSKKSVKVGSFWDRLFGREKTVIQYSANLTLKDVKGTKDMAVSTDLTTKDGTVVEGPKKTFAVSKNSIR